MRDSAAQRVSGTPLGATDRPRASRPARRRSRHIPAAVRRAVWTRDGGQCTFVGGAGRCGARGFLQFHHRDSFALGGAATVDLITLRCAAHNRYEAEQEFGLRPPGALTRHGARACNACGMRGIGANSVRTESRLTKAIPRVSAFERLLAGV